MIGGTRRSRGHLDEFLRVVEGIPVIPSAVERRLRPTGDEARRVRTEKEMLGREGLGELEGFPKYIN